jgi:hypothetical protein
MKVAVRVTKQEVATVLAVLAVVQAVVTVLAVVQVLGAQVVQEARRGRANPAKKWREASDSKLRTIGPLVGRRTCRRIRGRSRHPRSMCRSFRSPRRVTRCIQLLLLSCGLLFAGPASEGWPVTCACLVNSPSCG